MQEIRENLNTKKNLPNLCSCVKSVEMDFPPKINYSSTSRPAVTLCIFRIKVSCWTRVRGVTRGVVSARRWEGDGFDARPKSRHS